MNVPSHLRGVVVVRQDDHVVVVGRREVGEVAVRRVQVECDREVVDLLHAGRRQHATERRQRSALARRVGLQLVGVDHVISGERGAVVELDALADLEGPDIGGRVRRPACGQHRLQGQGLVRQAEVLTGLGQHVQAALISDGDRVNRPGGGDDSGLDRGGAGGGARRGRRAGCAGRAAGSQDSAEYGRGDPDQRARAQESPAADVTSDELVDDVIPDVCLVSTQPVKPVVSRMHRSSSEPSPDPLDSQSDASGQQSYASGRHCHGVRSLLCSVVS